MSANTPHKPVRILGVSAYYHDSAAALLQDGEILAAAQEERFTRIKQDSGFPHHAIDYCLRQAGLDSADQLDHIVFYDKPLIKFERILETFLAVAPAGLTSYFQVMPVWLTKKLRLRDQFREELGFDAKVLFTEHHESHAASAYYPSPFDEAAVLTVDGVGEWATTTMGVGRGSELTLEREIRFPHSLGLLYSALTYFLGFKVNSGEYKVMGLAPYGEPRFYDVMMRELIDVKDDGSFRLNQKYFGYLSTLRMTHRRLEKLFEGPPRQPETPVTQREMDLAASVQKVTETCMLRMTRALHERTGLKNLCMAGGVALNCVANGRILRETPFERIFVQPAAGDAGGALGAALTVWHRVLGQSRSERGPAAGDAMQGALLGPAYDVASIRELLQRLEVPFTELPDDELVDSCAQLIADEQVLGWFQGRMEFGPRALGSRSIVGDARSSKMQAVMNLKIKYRESFRPFAPAVLAHRAAEYFDLDVESPYMLLVAPVSEQRRVPLTPEQQQLFGIDRLNVPRSDVPAITHVDYSARVQTVNAQDNPRYHALIEAFEAKTGCPVIVNTSFNVRGEPIVESPLDAFRCFMRTEMDALALGNCMLHKKEMPPREAIDHKLGGPIHIELD